MSTETIELPRHLVRYGIPREAQYLSGKFQDSYDMLVVNGTSAAYMPSALTAFLSTKLHGKPFIIDPMTHAFQHASTYITSSSTGEPKKSVNKLAAALGEPFASRLGSRTPVRPSDFSPQVISDVVSKVTSFQISGFSDAAQESGDMDYLSFVGASSSLTPRFVVAPYFYMDEDPLGSQWADINAKMVERTASAIAGSHSVVAQLVLHQGLMREAWVNDLIGKITDTAIVGVMLWVDSLDERDASESVLRDYVNLIRRIGSIKPVFILHGSYLTIALSNLFPREGLAGVCHGLEYGESRAVVPVGGGLPISKFYYPSLHDRIPFDDALRLVRTYLNSADEYREHVCDCPMCNELLSRQSTPEQAFLQYGITNPVQMVRRGQSFLRNFPTMGARDRCVSHYMYIKSKEYREETDYEVVISGLRDAARYASEKVGSSTGRHCAIWVRILRSVADGSL